jgi:hypothetical protein
MDEVLTGDNDPNLMEYPTDRVARGLKSVREPRW